MSTPNGTVSTRATAIFMPLSKARSCSSLCSASRAETGKSYPQIGRGFGDRDHTTIMYAYRKVKKKLAAGDTDLQRDVERVKSAILDLQASA